MMDRPKAHRGRGRGAPGRAAGGHLVVPGIEGPAPQRVVRRRPHREFRGIGAAHDNRTRVEQVTHERRVVRRDQARQRGQAVRGGLPGNVDVLLDGHRNAVERSERSAPHHRPVLHPGIAHRLVRAIRHDGVEAPVVLRNAIEHRLHHLDARHFARPDHCDELHRTPAPEASVHQPAPFLNGTSFHVTTGV